MDSLASLMYSPPGRVGYTYILYQHPLTGFYQWINNPEFAALFGMIQIYPVPVFVVAVYDTAKYNSTAVYA